MPQLNLSVLVQPLPLLMSYTAAPLPTRRNIFAVWLGLPVVTLGIYPLVWYYKINKECNFDPNSDASPVGSLLAVTLGAFLIIPACVSVYKTGERIAAVQRSAGIEQSCRGEVGLILALLGLFTLYYQYELNKIPAAYPGYVPGQMVNLRVP